MVLKLFMLLFLSLYVAVQITGWLYYLVQEHLVNLLMRVSCLQLLTFIPHSSVCILVSLLEGSALGKTNKWLFLPMLLICLIPLQGVIRKKYGQIKWCLVVYTTNQVLCLIKQICCSAFSWDPYQSTSGLQQCIHTARNGTYLLLALHRIHTLQSNI